MIFLSTCRKLKPSGMPHGLDGKKKYAFFFFFQDYFCRAVLGSLQNWEGSTETSHIADAPTCA